MQVFAREGAKVIGAGRTEATLDEALATATERPIMLRTDYFDRKGLWKRYRLKPSDVERRFEWWVPMRDEMIDLRSGRRTVRRIRNLLIDAAVPDELFTITQLARGRMPSF